MLLFPAEKASVSLHEFADQEEGIDGCNTVVDESNHPLALGVVRLGSGQLIPKRVDLLVVLLDIGGKLFPLFAVRFERLVGQEAYQRAFYERLAEYNQQYNNQDVESAHQRECCHMADVR